MAKPEETKTDVLKEKIEYGKEICHEKAVKIDKYVKAKPYKAIGIVAGVVAVCGGVIGYLLGRKKNV